MKKSKLNGLEVDLASSVLYYDADEMNKFFDIFEAFSAEPYVAIDGMLTLFVSYLTKLVKGEGKEAMNEEDPEVRKSALVEGIRKRNNQRASADEREMFDLWLDKVEQTVVPMELAQDVLHHLIWEDYKKAVESIDKADIPFEDKLMVRPKIPQMLRNDGVLSMSQLVPKDRVYHSLVTTGIADMDHFVKVQQGNFMVVAARPGVGKSLFMIQMAMENAKRGVSCLYMSLEMSEDQMHSRVINYHAKTNIQEMFTDENDMLDYQGFLNEVDRIKSSASFANIEKNFKLLVTKKSSADAILSDIEDYVKRDHYDIVFLDYLQLMQFANMNEWESLRALTKALKNLAFRLGVRIVTGSQVSRSSTERGLNLTDLFGSTTIEADTDIVIGLEELRERKNETRAVINFKTMKNRDGPKGETRYMIDYTNGHIDPVQEYT